MTLRSVATLQAKGITLSGNGELNHFAALVDRCAGVLPFFVVVNLHRPAKRVDQFIGVEAKGFRGG